MPGFVPTLDQPVVLKTPFKPARVSTFTYPASGHIEKQAAASVAPAVVDLRPPGDHVARLYFGLVPTAQAPVYTAGDEIEAFVRRVVLVNESSAARTVTLWIAGRKVDTGVTLAANETKRRFCGLGIV